MEFVELKNHSRYLISRKGIVINSSTGVQLTGGVGNSGYLQVRLTDDFGVAKTWGIHRLLAWVFKANCECIDGLVINHIDGDKTNNDLDNLEITSYRENQLHAGRLGLTEKCKVVSVENFVTGVVTTYPSILACAESLGVSKDIISARCHKGETKVFMDGNRYKFGTSEFSKTSDTNKIKVLMDYGRRRPVVVRNVLTGKIEEFDSSQDAAVWIGCSSSSISTWARDEEQPIVPGFYQLQFLNEFKPWIDHDDVYVRYESDNDSRCVVWWSETGEKHIFSSLKECANFAGLNITTLHYRLGLRKLDKFKDNTRCIYYLDMVSLDRNI